MSQQQSQNLTFTDKEINGDILIQLNSKQFAMLVRYLEDCAKSTNNKKLCLTHWNIANRVQINPLMKNCKFVNRQSYATLEEHKTNNFLTTREKIIQLAKDANKCSFNSNEVVSIYLMSQGKCKENDSQNYQIHYNSQEHSTEQDMQEEFETKSDDILRIINPIIETQVSQNKSVNNKQKLQRSTKEMHIQSCIDSIKKDVSKTIEDKLEYLDEIIDEMTGYKSQFEKRMKGFEKQQSLLEEKFHSYIISNQKLTKTTKNKGKQIQKNQPENKLIIKSKDSEDDDEYVTDSEDELAIKEKQKKQEKEKLKSDTKNQLFGLKLDNLL